MSKLIYLFGMLLGLSSCIDFQPRIWDRKDPFTNVRTRSMYVSASDQSLIQDAMYTAGTGRAYRPKPVELPVSSYLTMIIEEGDTMLTFIRFNNDRAYDIPADSKMQLLLSPEGVPAIIVDMNLVRSYHTIGGPVIATGRVERYMLPALIENPIRTIRIEKVSTNQAGVEPVDWVLPYEYRETFQKGVSLLLYGSPPKPVRMPKPKKPKKLYYYK